ncbi:MAG: response regulator transcription factor [Spirochaetaceae bacterium]|jgi:DNA-binding NarL/FixJ family response regulator|nr:response regulator transcription factor [Spirochaetaceae bacterium]
MIKTIVIDTDSVFTEEISYLLANELCLDVIGIGNDAYDAINLIEKFEPEIAIVNHNLKTHTSSHILQTLKARSALTKVILISDTLDKDCLLSAVQYGAYGLITRKSVFSEMGKAIRAILDDKIYFSNEVMPKVFRLFSLLLKNKPGYSHGADYNLKMFFDDFNISKTEYQIACFIGNGFSNKEISGLLRLKETTIRNYISIILQKTGLEHRTQIAILVLTHGFVNKHPIGQKASLNFRNKDADKLWEFAEDQDMVSRRIVNKNETSHMQKSFIFEFT